MSAHTRTRKHRHSARSLESRAARKQRTRQALMQAALRLLEDRSFAGLSLREVAREAGIVPTGFYRHFDDMDELALALVDESFWSLREMLRSAREDDGGSEGLIRRSVAILVRHVHANRDHFAFIARERSSGMASLRRAIRAEIRLFSSELATDLARLPAMSGWGSDDLQMIAALMVTTMVSTVEAIVEAAPEDERAERAVIARAEKQLRLIALAMPTWRSAPARGPDPVEADVDESAAD